ncbi:efflux RND transporter periplasmic adaptor subunit [Vibrio sp. SCSIO 43137]|uniref:efflux RND transporter periplasmic adaptor subunit n=1 Tax=Vibrio sp. SCSIO 43137 TaxID=3021011 RepID=UPI0023078AE1|nr:efflux RND transporter periplasmic adaptor subunit [Vibrio sp. SCSIO 43137]WCE30764.1 efflux RND transporter periplasmic adaptor subunit [Vibrio sp. SCSIO 43137]
MKLKNILAILAGCGAIFAAIVVLDILQPEPVEAIEKPEVKTPVSVLKVTPENHKSSLTLLATTAARWPVKLKASSSAQLAWLNPDIEPGVLVTKGSSLAKLNTSALESNLAQANNSVKQAELNLKQALHEQTVALKMLSPSNSSPFARREPQVEAAKAALAQAKQSFTSAETLLKEANIEAPFDAVILSRNVSPGEWLEAGQVTFELAASDSLDVKLPVSETNWPQVKSALMDPALQVGNRSGNQWPAKVRYIAPQADSTSRQREVVLSVSQPYQGNNRLLPNQQVKVNISLGQQPEIVTLPLSALTRDGYVWTIDSQDKLQKEWVTLTGQSANQVFVRFEKQSDKSRQVVVYPLLSMLPGKQIAPQPAKLLMANKEANQ